MAETLPPAALREAVAALWRLRALDPRNLSKAPEFDRLLDICASLYPDARHPNARRLFLACALDNALDALGLPCRPQPADPRLALRAEIAAGRLHAAFNQSEISRVYLCPLNRADRLPELAFGTNRIARLTPAELEELVDLPRLMRINASWTFDAKLFSEFTWLVSKEKSGVRGPRERRAVPILFEPGGRDWGAIEPHRGRFPPAVEDALFAMLLVPREDWVDQPSGWWRPFEVPWVYTIDHDLFVRPKSPPSADELSWTYAPVDDGGEIFVDPDIVRLKDAGARASDWLTDQRWTETVTIESSELFGTPVKHFFVRHFSTVTIAVRSWWLSGLRKGRTD